MSNSIKYNTSSETLALKKGNFWFGTGDVEKGPTGTTGFWNGITPPPGGYAIYLNKASNGPSIYVAANDSQLITLTNQIAGTSFTSTTQCLDYFATQSDRVVFNRDYESIVTNGLVLNLDAGFTPSYPTSGTTWYDLSPSGNNGTLTNGPTFNSANGGSIVFDGANDFVSLPNGLLSGTGDFTIIQWVKTNGFGAGTTFGNYPSGNLQFGWGQSYVFLWLGNSSAYASISNFTTSVTMIAARRIGTTTNYLKNGIVISTGDSSFTIGGASAQFRLGTNTSGNETYAGDIYSTLVYNRGLSNTEILQNYNATKARFGL